MGNGVRRIPRPPQARARALRALRRFSWIAPAVVVPQFALGLLLYPTYRVRVRLPDLDKNAPHVAQLFDFKEHLAAVGLALILASALLARSVASGDEEQP